MLEIIAKDRNSTLSEAMELAISLLGRSYKIDSDKYSYNADFTPTVADYVRSQYEPLDRIYASIVQEARFYEIFSDDEDDGNLSDFGYKSTHDQIMSRLKNTPAPLLSSLERYIGAVIHNLEEETKYFYPDYLLESLEENWKEGISVSESQNQIKTAHEFYLNLVSATLEKNPPTNPDGSFKEIADYFKNLIEPYGNTEGELTSLHEIYEIKKLQKENLLLTDD